METQKMWKCKSASVVQVVFGALRSSDQKLDVVGH